MTIFTQHSYFKQFTDLVCWCVFIGHTKHCPVVTSYNRITEWVVDAIMWFPNGWKETHLTDSASYNLKKLHIHRVSATNVYQ